MIKKTKKPKFHRQNSQVKKRQGKRWRKPRGIDSKQREGFKSRGTKPTIGYRQPKKTRGKHPSGYKEVLIENIKQLERVDKKTQAVRISSKVGARKKTEIIKKAAERQLKVLNAKVNRKKKIKKAKKKEEKNKIEDKKTKDKKKEEVKKAENKKESTKTKKEEDLNKKSKEV